MTLFFTAVIGLGACVLVAYLVVLLYSIRRSGYGNGRLLELPSAGLALRYPEWWTLELGESEGRGPAAVAGGEGQGGGPCHAGVAGGQGGGEGEAGAASDGGGEAAPSPRIVLPGQPLAQLRTGHRRGLLTISLPPTSATIPQGREDARTAPDGSRTPAAPAALRSELRLSVDDLADALREILRAKDVVMDEMDIRAAPVGPPSSPAGWRATVASGGREAAGLEERSYLEFHLVDLGGSRTLFFYRNSVLQGFLDAFYLERMMETLRGLPR